MLHLQVYYFAEESVPQLEHVNETTEIPNENSFSTQHLQENNYEEGTINFKEFDEFRRKNEENGIKKKDSEDILDENFW